MFAALVPDDKVIDTMLNELSGASTFGYFGTSFVSQDVPHWIDIHSHCPHLGRRILDSFGALAQVQVCRHRSNAAEERPDEIDAVFETFLSEQFRCDILNRSLICLI